MGQIGSSMDDAWGRQPAGSGGGLYLRTTEYLFHQSICTSPKSIHRSIIHPVGQTNRSIEARVTGSSSGSARPPPWHRRAAAAAPCVEVLANKIERCGGAPLPTPRVDRMRACPAMKRQCAIDGLVNRLTLDTTHPPRTLDRMASRPRATLHHGPCLLAQQRKPTERWLPDVRAPLASLAWGCVFTGTCAGPPARSEPFHDVYTIGTRSMDAWHILPGPVLASKINGVL